VVQANTPTTSLTYILSYLRFKETMINPPMIKQPSWKEGELVTPVVAYSAKLKLPLKELPRRLRLLLLMSFSIIVPLNVFILPCTIMKKTLATTIVARR